MASEEETGPTIYRVEVSDTADAEADQAFFWLVGRSPELAGRWYSGLLDAYQSLSQLPNRCPLAPENEEFEAVEVRQLLYGSRRNVYRILFYIREAIGTEPATVRILHVRRGIRRWLGRSEHQSDESE
jgi:plasmid stabilization system protein ParE